MDNPTKNFDKRTLVTSLNSFIEKGYTEDFKAQESGLKALKNGKLYQANEIKVVDFHRFEGSTDPGDESILYAIETNDGIKGTLVDSYGAVNDTKVTAFMQQVEEISKKINNDEPK